MLSYHWFVNNIDDAVGLCEALLGIYSVHLSIGAVDIYHDDEILAVFHKMDPVIDVSLAFGRS
mgnify:CR=1 FL=1